MMRENLFIAHDRRVFETMMGNFLSATQSAEEDYENGVSYDAVKKKWLRECSRQVKAAAETLSLASGLWSENPKSGGA